MATKRKPTQKNEPEIHRIAADFQIGFREPPRSFFAGAVVRLKREIKIACPNARWNPETQRFEPDHDGSFVIPAGSELAYDFDTFYLGVMRHKCHIKIGDRSEYLYLKPDEVEAG